EVNFSPNW
nr:Pea-CAH-I peptide [Mastotermes darwiniensis]prf//2114372B Pea-CAH-I peptide [Trinervitermes trinervoides]